MKRLVCILMIVTLCLSVAVPCGAETRNKTNETIREYVLQLMQVLKDVYDKNKDEFPDSLMIALYEYYRVYQSTSGAIMAEYAISGTGSVELYKQVRTGEAELEEILDDMWLKWLRGEIDRTEALDVLMIMVDSVLMSQDEK